MNVTIKVAQALQELAKHIEQEQLTRRPTCVNCIYFEQVDELCQLCNTRPPAAVIAYACAKWEPKQPELYNDDIPF